MTTITWLGDEDESVKQTDWAGHVFRKGEAVKIDDFENARYLFEKAKGNRFFEVSGELPEDKGGVPSFVVPPSQQSTQGPAPKPGEPLQRGSTPSSPRPGTSSTPVTSTGQKPPEGQPKPAPGPAIPERKGENPESLEDQASGAGGQKPSPGSQDKIPSDKSK